jgi:hypothetical protein
MIKVPLKKNKIIHKTKTKKKGEDLRMKVFLDWQDQNLRTITQVENLWNAMKK